VLFCSTTSCKKFLDEKSNDQLRVPTTIEDLQALLDDAVKMNEGTTPCFGEASNDDYYLLESAYTSRPEDERNVYRWIPTDYDYGGLGNDWSLSYLPVYNSNLCLERIKSISLNATNAVQWNNVKGSALFYRAYYFSQLAWIYVKGYDNTTSATDLGIALRLNSDFNIPSKRATAEDTYQQIISDAKESIRLLPILSSHPYRPSRASAYGLLARTYLSMRQYGNALLYADSCLQLRNELMDYNAPCASCDVISTSATVTIPFKKFNKETIFYTSMSIEFPFAIASPSRAKVDTALFLSYSSNDLRKSTYFLSSTGWRFKGSYTQNITTLFTGIATDEMYLIRAECYARAGDKTSALADLNMLLRKRHTGTFTDITATDAADALNKILLERRKELLMRGLRWIDIKRLNKEGRNIIPTRLIAGQTYVLQPNANYYALPLPTDIINLTEMPQNPF